MIVYLLTLLSQGIYESGGLGEIIRRSSEGQRLNVWNFSLDMSIRYTFWSCFARGLVGGASLYGTTQTEVQRMLSMRNVKRAKSSFLWSIVPLSLLKVLCLSLGLVMYANFYSCDPIKDKVHTGIKKFDQVIPYYIVSRFSSYPGLTGLCIAGIFSGSLSSISSALNSVSTVTVLDFIKPRFPSQLTENRAVYVAKFLSAVYGITYIGISFALSTADSLFAVVSVFMGLAEGPVFGIFLIAVLTRKGSEKCALFGLIVGVAFTFWLGFGILFSDFRNPSLPLSTSGCSAGTLLNSTILCPLNATCAPAMMTQNTVSQSEPFVFYKISFLWLAPLGCLITVFFTLLAILVTGRKNFIEEDSKCLSPVVRLWKKVKPTESNPVEGICMDGKSSIAPLTIKTIHM